MSRVTTGPAAERRPAPAWQTACGKLTSIKGLISVTAILIHRKEVPQMMPNPEQQPVFYFHVFLRLPLTPGDSPPQ
jgi:hypothetical protein